MKNKMTYVKTNNGVAMVDYSQYDGLDYDCTPRKINVKNSIQQRMWSIKQLRDELPSSFESLLNQCVMFFKKGEAINFSSSPLWVDFLNLRNDDPRIKETIRLIKIHKANQNKKVEVVK